MFTGECPQYLGMITKSMDRLTIDANAMFFPSRKEENKDTVITVSSLFHLFNDT